MRAHLRFCVVVLPQVPIPARARLRPTTRNNSSPVSEKSKRQIREASAADNRISCEYTEEAGHTISTIVKFTLPYLNLSVENPTVGARSTDCGHASVRHRPDKNQATVHRTARHTQSSRAVVYLFLFWLEFVDDRRFSDVVETDDHD